MKTLHNDRGSCRIGEVRWPAYITACLRGARASAPYQEVRDHLAACPSCAAAFAGALAAFCWREAQEPFNAESLPPPTAWLPPYAGEGVCLDD
jgi:hypothetical protein